MTPRQMIKEIIAPHEVRDVALAEHGKALLTISPGPLEITINKSDIAALHFLDSMEFDDWKMGTLLDMLDQARWWVVFFGALAAEEKTPCA